MLITVYIVALYKLQIIEGEKYYEESRNNMVTTSTVTAARGNIVDSTGKRIATTSTGYNVVLNKLQMGDQDLDTMLQQIVELLRQNDEKCRPSALPPQPFLP